MGTIKKLFIKVALIAILIILWQMDIWEKSKIGFILVALLCVGGGAKMWLD